LTKSWEVLIGDGIVRTSGIVSKYKEYLICTLIFFIIYLILLCNNKNNAIIGIKINIELILN